MRALNPQTKEVNEMGIKDVLIWIDESRTVARTLEPIYVFENNMGLTYQEVSRSCLLEFHPGIFGFSYGEEQIKLGEELARGDSRLQYFLPDCEAPCYITRESITGGAVVTPRIGDTDAWREERRIRKRDQEEG